MIELHILEGVICLLAACVDLAIGFLKSKRDTTNLGC